MGCIIMKSIIFRGTALPSSGSETNQARSQQNQGATRVLRLSGFFLGLLFDSEDGTNMFLQSNDGLSLDYIALYPRR
jgi:hypothetical protein